MLAIILCILGVWLLLSTLDLLWGNRFFPGKVGVVEINEYANSDASVVTGKGYCIYKYHRFLLFFNRKKWFTSQDGSAYTNGLTDKSARQYLLVRYINKYMRNLSHWTNSFGEARCISNKDLTLLTAKVYANKQLNSDLIETRSEPKEIWNSKENTTRELIDEESELTLQLGEALIAEDKDKELAIMKVLKEKQYI